MSLQTPQNPIEAAGLATLIASFGAIVVAIINALAAVGPNQLRSLKEAIETLQTTVGTIQKENERLQERILSQNAEISALTTRVEALERERSGLLQKVAELGELNTDQARQICDLEAEVIRLKREKEELSGKLKKRGQDGN